MDGSKLALGAAAALAVAAELRRRRGSRGMAVLLAPRSQCPMTGPEKGRVPKNGIARLDDPYGSVRYLRMKDGRAVSVLQVMKQSDGTALIANVYTDPEHRWQGLARSLLERARRDFGTVRHNDSLTTMGEGWKAKVQGSRADDPRLATLRELERRIDPADFEAWGREDQEDCYDGLVAEPEWRLDLVDDYLQAKGDITVREDGLIEFGTLRADANEIAVEYVIGDLPVALYHHTATKALPAIRRQGLRSDVQRADRLSSGAGVYLTTESSGVVPQGYIMKAMRLHGGYPVSLTVRRHLWELTPDPDDEDISSGAVQFVTNYVPVDDIVEWE